MSDIGQKCPEVLSAFLGDYSRRLSASEIARETEVERRTVSRVLNKMVDLNLIRFVIQGKNKLFYLDLEGVNTFSLLNIVEINKSINFNFNNKKVSLIVSKLMNASEGCVVFGSYASGSSGKDSDLDVLLLGRVNLDDVKRIKKISNIEVNEHVVNFSDFEKLIKKHDALALEILANHIVFGDVSKVVKMFLEVFRNG